MEGGQFLRLSEAWLTLRVEAVTSEAEATHVSRSVLDQVRAEARRRVAEAEAARAERERELAAVRSQLQATQQEAARRQAMIDKLFKEKANWRRRALAGIGVTDPEDRERYHCDRHGQWWRILTQVLDCESGGEYAGLARSLAEAAAQKQKGRVTQVWRARGVWYAELWVPVRTAAKEPHRTP